MTANAWSEVSGGGRPTTADAADDPVACGFLAALAGFDKMTPSRLRHLLRGRSAADAFGMAAGTHRPSAALEAVFTRDRALQEVWRGEATRRQPGRCWDEMVAAGVRALSPDHPVFPPQLAADPACPAVLFARGDLDVLDARRVGIIGTRNATQAGRSTAARFGGELSEAGVVVLSGLARGIDAAAHRGALSCQTARPVGVVGNGLDLPYPKQNADLWHGVGERGLLLSEWPVGTRPDPFRFPLRNRILAALTEVLVVVESRERGGSLITAREATNRSVEVMAVPGSVHSAASIGTNKLLADGALTANDTADVLMALGLDHRRAGRARFDARWPLAGIDVVVYESCRSEPRTLDGIMLLTGASIGEAAMQLARLEQGGWLAETGGWFEAVDEWGTLT
jgi:DNA processing protein